MTHSCPPYKHKIRVSCGIWMSTDPLQSAPNTWTRAELVSGSAQNKLPKMKLPDGQNAKDCEACDFSDTTQSTESVALV